jgi:transposase-like protein
MIKWITITCPHCNHTFEDALPTSYGPSSYEVAMQALRPERECPNCNKTFNLYTGNNGKATFICSPEKKLTLKEKIMRFLGRYLP